MSHAQDLISSISIVDYPGYITDRSQMENVYRTDKICHGDLVSLEWLVNRIRKNQQTEHIWWFSGRGRSMYDKRTEQIDEFRYEVIWLYRCFMRRHPYFFAIDIDAERPL